MVQILDALPANFWPTFGNVHPQDVLVHCTGNETSLRECIGDGDGDGSGAPSFLPVGEVTCNSHAGVICEGMFLCFTYYHSAAKMQWPISQTITCNARDVIWRADYGGKNGEFLVFMDAEDSLEGLVKAATWKKVYKCLEVC